MRYGAGQVLRTRIFGNKPGTAVITTHFQPDVFDFDFQPPPAGGTDLYIICCAHNSFQQNPLCHEPPLSQCLCIKEDASHFYYSPIFRHSFDENRQLFWKINYSSFLQKTQRLFAGDSGKRQNKAYFLGKLMQSQFFTSFRDISTLVARANDTPSSHQFPTNLLPLIKWERHVVAVATQQA